MTDPVRAAKPPILVTGAHRSGTTWVGRMLAAAPGVAYIHEPFNTRLPPGRCNARLPCNYAYITPENEAPYLAPVRDTLGFRYALGPALRAVRSRKDLARLTRDWRAFRRARRRGARPLLKDPIALLSAEWLAHRFGAQVVVMIRHPAAFAASIKALGWDFKFARNFLGQPDLMRDHLGPFADRIRACVTHPGDLVAEAALTWSALYHVVSVYRERHPDWTYVRHEDLARDPAAGFERLYRTLGLEMTGAAAATIAAHSGPQTAAPRHAHDVRRDSRAAIASWKGRLTPEEIARVRDGTAGVAERFYADADW